MSATENIRRGFELVRSDLKATTGLSIGAWTLVQSDESYEVTLTLGTGTVGWTLDPDSSATAAVEIAGELQHEIEFMLRMPWPQCPASSRAHSLVPLLRSAEAVWRCDEHDIATPIGSLGSPPS